MAENELEASLRAYLEATTAQVPIKYIKVRGKTHRLNGIKVFEHIADIMQYISNTGKEFDDQDVAGAQALKEVNESITSTIETVVTPKLEETESKITALENSFSEALTNLKNTPIAKAIGVSGTTFPTVIEEIKAIVNQGTLNWNPSSSTTKTIPAGYYSGGTISTTNAYSDGYSSGVNSGKNAMLNDLYYLSGVSQTRGDNQYISVSGEIVAYHCCALAAGGVSIPNQARIARHKSRGVWTTDDSHSDTYASIYASGSRLYFPSNIINCGYVIIYR